MENVLRTFNLWANLDALICTTTTTLIFKSNTDGVTSQFSDKCLQRLSIKIAWNLLQSYGGDWRHKIFTAVSFKVLTTYCLIQKVLFGPQAKNQLCSAVSTQSFFEDYGDFTLPKRNIFLALLYSIHCLGFEINVWMKVKNNFELWWLPKRTIRLKTEHGNSNFCRENSGSNSGVKWQKLNVSISLLIAWVDPLKVIILKPTWYSWRQRQKTLNKHDLLKENYCMTRELNCAIVQYGKMNTCLLEET